MVKDLCDSVAVMNHGKLEEVGDVYKVFTEPEKEFTAQLIAHTYDFEIPRNILSGITGKVIKLTYLGERATDAVLSDTAKEFSVRYNILHGKIEYIGEKPLGILYVNIIGDSDSVENTIRVLEEKVEKLEVLKNA